MLNKKHTRLLDVVKYIFTTHSFELLHFSVTNKAMSVGDSA